MMPEDPYHALLNYILTYGVRKPTRAVLKSTGEKISALSVFGYQARFDLRRTLPVVTTKKLFWRGVVEELLFFLRGETNIRTLQERGVHIWDDWSRPNGDVGPVYGYQWRNFLGDNGKAADQIRYVLEGILATKKDPTASVGRRLVVNAWHAADIPEMGLPPCHVLFQFGIAQGELSCHMVMRSADAFLGVPFNIASYALLTCLFAHLTGLEPGDLVVSFSDLHIYENHLEQVQEQLAREPFPGPRLGFRLAAVPEGDLGVILDPARLAMLTAEDFPLAGYQHHPALKGEVAV
jgi:thymidylate synthase